METTTDTVIRGHHIYKEIWTPSIGEVLQCEKEEGNSHDLYAVAVKKLDLIVGHVPRTISTLCHLFLSRGGIITCTIRDTRKFSDDLPQGGLEVPCQLTFRGDKSAIEKVKRLLHDKPKDQLKDKPQKTIEELVAKPIKLHTSPSTCHSEGNSKLNVLHDDIFVNVDEKNEVSTGSETNDSGVSSMAKIKASEIMVKSKCEEILYITEESDDCLSGDNVVWLKLCRVQLLESDRKALLTFGYQLNDKHINLAQKLLKNKHSNIERGLYQHFLRAKITTKKYSMAYKSSFVMAITGLLQVT